MWRAQNLSHVVSEPSHELRDDVSFLSIRPVANPVLAFTGGILVARRRTNPATHAWCTPRVFFCHALLSLQLTFGIVASPLTTAAEGLNEVHYGAVANAVSSLSSFVDWPSGVLASPKASFIICTLGDASLEAALTKATHNRSTQNHQIEVWGSPKEKDLHSCQILFISRQQKKNYAKILAAVRGASVLTVGETSDFIDSGGVVGLLFQSESTLQFEVNLDAADQASLKIHSGLLATARRVTQKSTEAKS